MAVAGDVVAATTALTRMAFGRAGLAAFVTADVHGRVRLPPMAMLHLRGASAEARP